MKNEKNILVAVIDNDIMTRVTLEEILEEAGFTVECYKTGSEGMRRVLNSYVDVLLIDVRLPDMNGIEVLRLTKEHQPSSCCILMTAYPTVEDAVKALKIGAYDYLEKPVDFKLIVETIRRAIEENVISSGHAIKRMGKDHEYNDKKEQTRC
jgi:DNA-binding NtrC family response regulator